MLILLYALIIGALVVSILEAMGKAPGWIAPVLLAVGLAIVAFGVKAGGV